MHLKEESYWPLGINSGEVVQRGSRSARSHIRSSPVKEKEVEVHSEVGNCCVSQHELRSTERIQRSKRIQYGSDHQINARERSYHSPLGHQYKSDLYPVNASERRTSTVNRRPVKAPMDAAESLRLTATIIAVP